MIGLFNKLIEGIGAILGWILNLLPETPFHWEMVQGLTGAFAFLNWLIPIPILITQLNLFVTAVAVYYGLRIALRWIKAAGSG